MKGRKYCLLLAGIGIVLTGIRVQEGACAGEGEKDSLYERGLALVERMDLKAETPEYYRLMSTSEELVQVLEEIGGQDYSVPEQVYEMDLSEIALNYWQEAFGEDLSEMPEELLTDAEQSCLRGIASMIAGQGGVVNLAAVSLLNSNSYFLDETLEEPVSYYYLYGTQYGAVVTFLPQDENIVVANGSFVVDESLEEIRSEEDFEEWIEQKGFPQIKVSAVF